MLFNVNWWTKFEYLAIAGFPFTFAIFFVFWIFKLFPESMYFEKHKKACKNWSKIRWAVAVRPYALHILEEAAKRQEEYRIAQAQNGIIDDPLEL